MSALIPLWATHFIGDFGFQNDWMGMNKGKSWEVLVYHVLTVNSCMALLPLLGIHVTFWAILIRILTHGLIDVLKARYKVIKEIWQDQALHLVVDLILVITGLVY